MKDNIYRFREFELEPAERRLSQGSRPLALTPKAFDTLVLLVERAGHIVTKEELMRAIWPRGYVEDSNLTKHIWFIRRALGEAETEASVIETVPKTGYRFTAAVTIVGRNPDSPVRLVSELNVAASAATAAAPAAPTPEGGEVQGNSRDHPAASRTSPWREPLLLGALCAAIVLAGLGLLLLKHLNERGAEPHTLALLGFSNLSANAKDTWVGSALTDMLAAQLNAAQNLQVVPDELVRSVSLDLPLPSASGYSIETLERLRRRLKVDYVISGSYLVSSSLEDAPLRVDLALQDTRSHRVLVAVSRNSHLNELIALSGEAGNAVLGTLGFRRHEGESLARVEKLMPPSIDVARRMGFALDALDHYDPARARDELLQAIAESPGYAQPYSYLSRAWAALGYQDKALAAAEQAAALSTDMPAEQRLEALAVASISRGDWRLAGHEWSALVTLRPNDVDYRLHAIDASIAAGADAEARAGLAALRPLAPGDPRVELTAARLASSFDDAQGAEHAAAEALHLAQQRDAAGLIAEAEMALAGARMHLKRDEAARSGLQEAILTYRAIHNPRGEAAARNGLAGALVHLNRNQEAREEYQRAMVLYQSIGDLSGQATVYRNLCDMLWNAGDRDGAQAAARRGLELGRMTGDIPMQSWTLQALATIQSDDSASDEVLKEFREVVNLNERSGHQTAWPLANVADVQRLRGELEVAKVTCEQSLSQAGRLSDPQFIVFSTFTCGLIADDQGDATQARTHLNEVMRRAQAGGAQTYVRDSQMMLARLDMEDSHFSEACGRLSAARDGFAAAEERTGEADASALLALCEQFRGNLKASDLALAHAKQLRRAITSRQEVYQVDIVSARLDGTERGAIQHLLQLAADAEQRRFVGWALEARLAAWQLAQAHGLSQAAELRGSLKAEARRFGYGRILRLLNNSSVRRRA